MPSAAYLIGVNTGATHPDCAVIEPQGHPLLVRAKAISLTAWGQVLHCHNLTAWGQVLHCHNRTVHCRCPVDSGSTALLISRDKSSGTIAQARMRVSLFKT